MEFPLISVIVPIYKVEAYIEKCLTSIMAQTYERLEVILVDDGSPDQSMEKAKRLTKKDNRYIYIYKENGGSSSARNAGLDVATGEYVVFVDSDDFLFEDSIERLYHAIRLLDKKLAIADFCRFKEGRFSFPHSQSIGVTMFDSATVLDKMNHSLFNYMNFTSSCGKIFKRELFDDIRFPLGKTCEDSFILWKLYLKAEQLIYFEHPLYVYRDTPNSVMNSYNLSQLDSIEALEEKIQKMEELGYPLQSTLVFYRDHLQWHIGMLEKMGFEQEKEALCSKLEKLVNGQHGDLFR